MSITSRIARTTHHRRGILAEYIALCLLTLKGYRFVCWRYKTPVGEIDLVMRRGGTLVFVEVKARATRASAAEAVHQKNQSRVVRASQLFVASHPIYAHHQVRFDVVLITWYSMPHHLVHAFGEH